MTNPYRVTQNYNAVFTFLDRSGFEIDPETGNLTASSSAQSILVKATLYQAKDPNLELQPGLDFNRVFFTGYLIDPQEYSATLQSKGIPAVVNDKIGLFDFVPVFETTQSIAVHAVGIIGKRIQGYFRIT